MSTSPSSRPTAFALHALGSSARAFDGVAEALADSLDVQAIDLPGFGDAAAMTGTSIPETIRHVERAIRRSGATRWILVGHSMGGKIASMVAARALAGESELFGLAGVALLAASPPVPEPMEEDRRRQMLSWAQGDAISAEDARTFVDANVGTGLAPDADARAIDDVRRTSTAAWRAWFETGSREDRSTDVGVLDLPALILAGGEDGDLGEDAQRRLNETVYPRADVEVLPGVGHLLPLERPLAVADAIRRFWTTSAGVGPAVPPDVAAVIASPRTSARTRGLLAQRAVADDPRATPQALTDVQLATLRVLADRVVPQDEPAIDIALRVDTQLAGGGGDGWRNADLPTDREAYAIALDALAPLRTRSPRELDTVIAQLSEGTYDEHDHFTAAQFAAWFEDARVDLVRQWLAHPATMARIGFDGFANGGDDVFTGFALLGADEREDWEMLPVIPR
ncbi:pimeloyl-ACP methyl ester carboxylesterase [Labedella gwakjiensis]|uniref:Alpha/beta fold hydrolase n=1 Tax=Labedella gwakjiensis TaxID=390269 RepID=A0A2P8GUC7_9MICO|nr:alpha/beta fold hydrolase [Labedella gwakjiensis]PSL37570.1 pimeloyl-ACP methyl ester carboxylesterase [Labedella gwakjiensis]RUQ84870.1 alpha/beta fold hydrolase [Labedella gwakjiensis]